MWSLIMGAVSSTEEMSDSEVKSSSNSYNKEVKIVPPQKICDLESKSAPGDNASLSSGREQGDGMEKPIAPPTQTTEVKSTQNLDRAVNGKQLIVIPDAGLTLDKLPPISDMVDLPPVVPRNPLVAEKPKLYTKGSFPPSGKRLKEPKFVPYEPYKGAVAFMEESIPSPNKKISRTNRSTSVESEVFSRNDSTISCTSPLNDELTQNYRTMLDAKENEIKRLKESLEIAEKQLKIQTKVNAEVKKLLVASVGEDIEARVDFLTQDKARLAADVIEYNNRIATDWEKKEALGVESDVWRSKFLASTLIVEEVTKTKQAAQQRAEDLEHLGRRLLMERTQLKNSLTLTQLNLDRMLQAFDPSSTVRTDFQQFDTLRAAESLLSNSQALCVRLIGQNKIEYPDLPPFHAVDSPAEGELKKLLSKPIDVSGKVPDQACNVLASNARLHLLKLGDMADSPHQHGHDQFKTCSHCSGSVQDV